MAEASRKITYYWPVVLGFVVFAVSVSGARDPYFITGCLLALLSGILGSGKSIRLTGLDCAVLAVWLYELVLLFTSATSHIGPLRTLTVTAMYYGVLRAGFVRIGRMKPFLFWCSSFLFVMSLIALVSFSLFEQNVSAGGFKDLYDFRFLHNSLGYLGNVWGTLLLGFLGVIALAAYFYRDRKGRCTVLLLMTAPVVWGVIRSFSRGVYVAFGLMLAVFLVSLLVARVSWRRKLAGCAIVLGALALMAAPYQNEVLRTVRMTETASQRRSIAGRLDGATVTREIARQHPWVGVGSGNFSLAANAYLYENNYTPFTSTGLGTGFQLPVEKGIIGVLLWLAIPGILVWMLVKDRNRNTGTNVIFTTLGAVALREMTFPVLLDYAGMQIVAFTLIAVYRNSFRGMPAVCAVPKAASRWIAWVPAVACASILAVSLGRQASERANIACLNAAEAGDLESAESHILRAGDRLPYRINRSAVHWQLFLRTGDRKYLAQAERDLRAAAAQNPLDVPLTYNLAVVLDAAGAKDSSLRLMGDLAGRFPDNALYRLTWFEMGRRGGQPAGADTANLTRAIALAPGILDTPLWAELKKKDSALCAAVASSLRLQAENLCAAIAGNKSHSEDRSENLPIKMRYNPIEVAHYGKIMFIFGCRELSFALLSEAVGQLPNLSKPWCHLGILALERGDTARGLKYIRRSALLDPQDTLTQRYLTKYTTPARKPATTKVNVAVYPYRFLYRIPRVKFRAWYDAMPLTFDYIGSSKPDLHIETK